MDNVLVHPGKCNIPIVDGQSLTNREFLKRFAYESPFVLRDATDNTVRTLTFYIHNTYLNFYPRVISQIFLITGPM